MKGEQVMIKAVIFDVDGTLYDYHENDVIAMKSLCKFVEDKLNVDEELFLKIYDEAKTIVKTRLTEGSGQHSRMLFCQTALELMNKNPFLYATDMYEAYWGEFLKHMKLYDGALEFLQNLKTQNIKTAVCTDMTAHIQYRKIQQLGIADLIDAIVTSEETGLEKPSPAMFKLALKKLNVDAKDTAYFGDSLERDVKCADNCGLIPFWFIDSRKVDDNEGVGYTRVKSYRDVRL